jgi:dCMP deaminase
MNKMDRPEKDRYYLNIAKEVAERSTCFRNKGGAVVVNEGQIVSTGYIGAPRKTKDCFERGYCLRDKLKIVHGTRYEMCRSVHAEMNAIVNAARSRASVLGGDMYIHSRDKRGKEIDSFPCFICKRLIINAGINRVICSTKEKGIKIFKVEDWVKDWQEKDMLDDEYRYGEDLNKIDNLK